MKLACLFSGGKDSNLALFTALSQGFDVSHLVTAMPESSASHMFHHPNANWAYLQAKSIAIKHVSKRIASEKNAELAELKKLLEKLPVGGVVSGAVASDYQREKIDFICAELGFLHLAPLWHKNQESLLNEISENFHAIITSVSADGFDETWLGRKIDAACISDLKSLNKKFNINLSGEGGEYDTFVLRSPLFRKGIKIMKAEKIWSKSSGVLKILEANRTAEGRTPPQFQGPPDPPPK